MNTLITFAIIAAVGISSSVATFKIWEKEAFKNYDKYDKALREANHRISELLEENSNMQAQIAEQNIRLNPAQAEFFYIPSKKEYRTHKDLFGEF